MQFSMRSVRITPPKCWPASNTTYSTEAPADFCFWSEYAAESPAVPPPMTAILFVMSVGGWNNCAGLDDLCQRRGEQRRVVQRPRAPQAHSLRFCKFFEPHIDVVKDFDVIAKKPDRLNEDAIMARRFHIEDGLFHCGSSQLPPDMPWLWKAKRQSEL